MSFSHVSSDDERNGKSKRQSSEVNESKVYLAMD